MLRSGRPMDIDTASAIDQLGERIDVLDNRIDMLDSDVRDESAKVRDELREGLAEVRRHAAILNESTRDDIRLVAEAVAVLAVKIDALHR